MSIHESLYPTCPYCKQCLNEETIEVKTLLINGANCIVKPIECGECGKPYVILSNSSLICDVAKLRDLTMSDKVWVLTCLSADGPFPLPLVFSNADRAKRWLVEQITREAADLPLEKRADYIQIQRDGWITPSIYFMVHQDIEYHLREQLIL